MKYALPPLHALRAFESIARLRSFTGAAEELFLTHSAVSHQIRALEDFLGTRLFERTSRSVKLTPAGAEFVDVVREALARLSEGSNAIRNRGTKRLNVSVLPSFGSRWLLPRLGNFLQLNPDLDVQVSATKTLVDMDTSGTDVAIRYGKGDWPDVISQLLLEEDVFPVASASFIRKWKIRRKHDLQRCPLLVDNFQPWGPWLAHTGIDAASCTFGATYGDAALTLQAAELGQGVALGRSWLVADALKSGTLQRIGRVAVNAAGAYYMVFPKHRKRTSETLVFCKWLQEACGVPSLEPEAQAREWVQNAGH